MKARAVVVIAAATVALIAFAASASASAAPAPPVSITGAAVAAPVPYATAAQATPGDTAPRSPLNTASDKVALNAYASYLGSVLKATSTGQAANSAYISAISTQCRSALALLTQSNYQVNSGAQATLTALGEEMGDDLSIAFDGAVITPFLKLANALQPLRWNRISGGTLIIKHFVSAQSAVLYMGPSELCQDALLAGSSPETIPQKTKGFTRAYSKASRQANAALAAVLTLMQTYETPSEKAVVARIASLAGQISRITKADLMSGASSLSNVLENV